MTFRNFNKIYQLFIKSSIILMEIRAKALKNRPLATFDVLLNVSQREKMYVNYNKRRGYVSVSC